MTLRNKIGLSLCLLLVCMQAFAWTSPVDLPDMGESRLRIVGQNARNYIKDFTATNADVKNESDFKEKTDKMANVFLALQADIVALCEVEENNQILGYITSAMNSISGTDVYTYVTDDLNASQSSSGYMPLKAGFIYRSDRVATVGSNSYPPKTTWGYRSRMRYQAFKELATDEVFTLSMNHFKAKESNSATDETEATRIENATQLKNGLSWVSVDPDILIMGDLNANTEEEPVQILIKAGYEEQLVRFDPAAYSYIYKGKKNLIDHVLANKPMAAQVTAAYAYHINTGASYKYKFSDHDTYVVGLCLGENGCELTAIRTPEANSRAQKTIENGQLIITLPDGSVYNGVGLRIR